MKSGAFSRREFLRRSALASGYGLANFLDQRQQSSLALIADAADPVASAPAAVWAMRIGEGAFAAGSYGTTGSEQTLPRSTLDR